MWDFQLHKPEDRAKQPDAIFKGLGWFGDDIARLVRPDGPLFFLTIRREELKANYRVKVLADDDKQQSLQLVPRSSMSRSDSSEIRIRLNKGTMLPEVVRLISPAGLDIITIRYTRITVNPEIKEDRFRPPLPENWNAMLPQPAPDAAIDEILAKWGEKSAEIRSVKATFKREGTNPSSEKKVRYRGWFASNGGGSARLDVARVKEDETIAPVERFVVNGRELKWFQVPTRSVAIFPGFMPQGERERIAETGEGPPGRWLRAFGIGPIDLLRTDGPNLFLTIRPEEARRRFRIELVEEKPTHYLLRFMPLADREASELSEALVLLDKSTFLPDTVRHVRRGHEQSRVIHFEKIEINPRFPADYFQPEIPHGWIVTQYPDFADAHDEPARP